MAEAIADVLRTRRLEVFDADDVLRAVVWCANDDPDQIEDAVYIELRDPKGKGLVYLIANYDGASMQWWGGGNDLMRLYSNRGGEAGVKVYGAGSVIPVGVLDNQPEGEDR